MIETHADWRIGGQPRRRDAEAALQALAERARDEMERIEAFGRRWLAAPDEADAYNVVICGAGMSGLALAFGLKRRGIEGVALIDRSPHGAEGPWLASARMKTLRSPKTLAGPDLGIPSLTPRSWYEASYGAAAWDALDKLDRRDWANYLQWFRAVTEPLVFNQCKLTAVEPDPFGLALRLEGGGRPVRLRCRRLVMATGAGAPLVPDFVQALPKPFWTHSAEPAPDPDFAGRDYIVLGAAASSVDWAVTALEAGARRVQLIARAPRFARTEVLDWTNFPGFLDHYAGLDDATRWRLARAYFRLKAPPTQDQFDRARAYPQFSVELGRRLLDASVENGRVRLRHDAGVSEADHLLLGTGYSPDIAACEPLQRFGELALHWRDRAPEGAQDEHIGAHPYLGPGFELLPKAPARDGWISRVHLFNNAAIPSLGPVSNGLTGMKSGAPRLIGAVAGALFAENADRFAAALEAYDHAHFDPRGLGETGETSP